MIGSTLGLVGAGVVALSRLGRVVEAVPPASASGVGGGADAGRPAVRVAFTTTTTTTLPPPEGLLTFPVDPTGGVVVYDNFGGWSAASGACSHAGVDMFPSDGQPGRPLVACTHAVLTGKRVYPDPRGWAQGNAWILTDANGDVYRYHHMQDFEDGLDVGSAVVPGQVIGSMGSTGNAGAAHLHFEIRRGGTAGPAEDPVPLLHFPDGVVLRPGDDRCS